MDGGDIVENTKITHNNLSRSIEVTNDGDGWEAGALDFGS